MQCPQCNQNNPANIARCRNCGTTLSTGLSIGKVVNGKYRILSHLSKGGMGTLYLASQMLARQERKVVVKEMIEYYNPQLPHSQAKARQRFEAEAATLASLNVPGVPQIFDFFAEDGHHCIVMQFVEGQDLENGLAQLGRPYPVEQVRRWGIRLCRILESLAAQNVFHLDIKPANLIVDRHGEIWLVDFGTSKFQSLSSTGTRPGLKKSSVYGTIGYAPPEQIAGKPEAGSDVYALAATLYHLATGDDPGDHPGDFPHLDRLPRHIVQALRLALNQDVRQRITAAGFERQLEIHTGPIPVFHWQDGTISHLPRDLVAEADRKWAEALQYFTGDAWSNWFQAIHYNHLPVKMQDIKKQQPNQDLALDLFLRVLDTNYPPPRLEVPTPSLDLGTIPWQTRHEMTVQVLNRGSGCLQGQFTQVPLGLLVEPTEFTTHSDASIKVKLNTGLLSPDKQAQTMHLEIEAGSGGKVRLPIKVIVPEPALEIDLSSLDIGSTPRGHVLVYPMQVSNRGHSPFKGEVHSNATWVTAAPNRFLCAPGGRKTVELKLNTQALPLATHQTQVSVSASAGKWEQTAHIPVTVQVSAFKTVWKYFAPPMAWTGAGGIYGACFGTILGTILGKIFVSIGGAGSGILAGILLGVMIYILIGILIGGLGGIPSVRGLSGIKQGLKYSLAAGSLAGAFAGYFSFRLLQWLEVAVYNGRGWGGFGSLTGLFAGLLLGAALWLMARQ